MNCKRCGRRQGGRDAYKGNGPEDLEGING